MVGPDPVDPGVVAQLEAVLFASDTPLALERLGEALEADLEAVRLGLEALREACDRPERGLAVVEVAGGYRLVTRPEVAPALLRHQRLRLRSRLSRAAVETLAIVAYRQPVSRPEIEQLRGVSADHVLTALLDRRLIRVVGRRAVPGRPILYGTTREFLEHFGLRDLTELPPFEVPEEAAAALAAARGPETTDVSQPLAADDDTSRLMAEEEPAGAATGGGEAVDGLDTGGAGPGGSLVTMDLSGEGGPEPDGPDATDGPAAAGSSGPDGGTGLRQPES